MGKRRAFPKAKRKRLIFDNDGTVTDSLPQIDAAYRTALQPYDRIPEDAIVPFFRKTTGLHFTQQVRDLCAVHGYDVSEEEALLLHDRFDACMRNIEVSYFPDAVMTLALLAQTNDLFVSSAAPDRAVWHAIAHGVASNCFLVGFGSTLAPKGAAHIEGFARTLRTPLADFCASAVWIGDSIQDMRVARESGIYAIGVRGSDTDAHLRAAGANMLVDSIADLREVLKQ